MKRKMRIVAMLTSLFMLVATCGFTLAKSTTNVDKPYVVKMAFLTLGNAPKDLQVVEDAINKITVAKINEKIKLMPMNMSAYWQQMNLILAGNEQLDLMATFNNVFTQYASSGQIIPIDKLLASDGKDIVKALGKEYLVSGKVNGKTYAVTNFRDLASGYGIMMRKDLVDKYKINVEKIKSINDLDAVFKIIKKNEPSMSAIIPPLVSSIMSILGPLGSGAQASDLLTDGNGVLMLNNPSLKVVDWFETKEYASLLKTVRAWNLAGYCLPDAATNQESAGSLVKAGRAFSYISGTKPGFVGQESRNAGTQLIEVSLAKPTTSTVNLQTIQWAITKNSKDPVKSMRMLNLLYSDAEVANLLSWGIEGKHYVKTSTANTIDYPKGVDGSNSGYNIQVQWEFPNQFITHIWKGDSPSLWTDTDKFNRAAIKSKAFGFTFSPTKVKTEEASVTNVLNQYKGVLDSGAVDPNKVLPEFIAKLKAAGIDRIVTEKQKQLNEWLIKNK